MIIKQGSLNTLEEQSPRHRFKEKRGRRILQVLWIVTTYNSGVPHERHGEWHDVECVGPDAPDVEVL